MKKTLSQIAKTLGKRGGLTTKKNQPPDYYKKIGKLGGKSNRKTNAPPMPDPRNAGKPSTVCLCNAVKKFNNKQICEHGNAL